MSGPTLLGVDGGGTSTTAWLADADGRVLGRGLAGPSNIKAVGAAAARDGLERSIRAAFEDAGLEVGPVAVSCLGLAGFDRPEDRRWLDEWAAGTRWAGRLVLVNDGDLVVAAGTPEGWGVGVISGTGSIAVGRSPDGRSARSGGWGPLFGDEGSGYAVALAGLRRVARHADGRAGRAITFDPLSARLCEALGIAGTEELVTAVYREGVDRTRLAALAPVVVAASAEDPSIFAEVLEPAGTELALMVASVARQLGSISGPLPLAMAGSFLLNTPAVSHVLMNRLVERGYEVQASPVRDPVEGALLLARRGALAMSRMVPRVETGLDRFASGGFAEFRGLTVGVIANPTSVDRRMRHLVDLLAEAPGVTVGALFGPEHGIRADAQDMIGVESGLDARTGVPVHTLYGPTAASLTPTPDQLAGLDALIFDVQDVGSRYYTFAATMLYAMQAAAPLGIRFFVLDRPNPIGGELIEGPTIRPGFASFVGAHPMPIRHGMTVGELARMFREERAIDVDLTVIPVEGWSRPMLWAETGLHWVIPSPNMPTPVTALVYPGGCLIEGTNLSEGRGTTRPFELWGAPWLDPGPPARPARWTEGALPRPCAFRPTFHKHAGETCFGVQPHVDDPDRFAPAWFYTAMIAEARRQRPDRFSWRREPYEFVSEPIAIDLLYGSDRERRLIDSGPGPDELEDLRALWAIDEAEFRARRAPFLLYD